MSVSIATMGMFSQCCRPAGAPPYRQNSEEEKPKLRVLVTDVEIEDRKNKDCLDIKVDLLDFDK